MNSETHERHAFVMTLNPGHAAEYKRRHDAIWPELSALLREAGITNYSIHLHAQSGQLFAYMERARSFDGAALKTHPVMRRWWEAMRDLMQTHPDGEPVVVDLAEMFHQA
ncbi:MAG: L-rhamnose mutarotase [Pseudomonadota bacterium]